MQHHGAPTRLLDWTASPYVAAYFAVEKDPKKDGAIYVVQPALLYQTYGGVPSYPDEDFQKTIRTPSAQDRVYFFWPDYRTERFRAQQAQFSFNSNILGQHDATFIASLTQAAKQNPTLTVFEQWIIPSGNKPEFLKHLRIMNVASHALFPGLDGLGRSLTELVRLKAGI